MAKRNKAEGEEQTNGIVKPLAAEGYAPAGAGDNAAWTQMTEGAVWAGELMGCFQMSKPDKSGKRRSYYQLRIGESPFIDSEKREYVPMGIVRDPETEEFGEEPVPLMVGDLVNIDCRYALDQSLQPLCKSMTTQGLRFNVIIQALNKKSIGGGQTLWRFNVLKAPIGDDKHAGDKLPF